MSGYRTPAIGALDHVNAERERTQEQLVELQRPSGTSVEELVKRVTENLATVDARIDAGVQERSYSKADIDARVANPPSVTTSTVTAAGAITASGNIASLGEVYSDLPLRSPGSRNYNVSTNYVAGWINSDGTIGTSQSSRRFKQDIEEATIDPKAVLGLQLFQFRYIDEVRKRDDPTHPNYEGPDYHVQVNLSVMAEDLHEAGLWQFVVYEREPITETRMETVLERVIVIDADGTEHPDVREVQRPVEHVVREELKLDEDGEPIPYSVHHILFGLMLLPVVQDHEARLTALEGLIHG